MVSDRFVNLLIRTLRHGVAVQNLTAEGLGSHVVSRTLNKTEPLDSITAKRSFSSISKRDNTPTRPAVSTQNIKASAATTTAASSQAQVISIRTQKYGNSIMKKLQKYLTTFTTKNSKSEEPAAVQPYANIPGPRGLPLLGSALNYTALGKFSPKEYHKALQYNHKK